MSNSLQKCAGGSPTNYWGRLLSESLTGDEPRDQQVLRAIQGVNQDKLSLDDLAQQLFDSEEFSSRFEHFGSAFEATKLSSLSAALYAIIRHEMGRNYRRDGVPGFFVLWRLMGGSNATRHDPSLEAWALEELLKSLPGQIGFANEIYYFWLGGPEALPEHILPVREAVMARLRNALEGREVPSLGDCLNENFPYNLFHLFYTSNYVKKDQGMAPLSDDSDWAWLGPNLLRAARECPGKILPQIIIAVERNDTRGWGDGVRYEFDRPRLETLFGEGYQEIRTLIASGFPINPAFDPTVTHAMELAIEKAKRL